MFVFLKVLSVKRVDPDPLGHFGRLVAWEDLGGCSSGNRSQGVHSLSAEVKSPPHKFTAPAGEPLRLCIRCARTVQKVLQWLRLKVKDEKVV